MRKSFIKKLHCPFCSGNFTITKIINEEDDELVNALIECSCSQYPIVNGILSLKPPDDKNQKAAVDAIGAAQTILALEILLSTVEKSKKLWSRIIRKGAQLRFPLTSYYLRVYRHKKTQAFLACKTLLLALDQLNLGNYSNYLKHRFSHPSFLASLPLISRMCRDGGPILDLGCGIGHHCFRFCEHVRPSEIVGVDRWFLQLYLAKKFFIPEGTFICLDANYPLPFEDSYFHTTFSSDVFNYILCKQIAAKEIMRTTKNEGLLILSHLHNKEMQNLVPGFPLSAGGWRSLFQGLEARIVNESWFLKANEYVHHQGFLSYPQGLEPSSAKTFTLIASRKRVDLREFASFEIRVNSNREKTVINPLYSRRRVEQDKYSDIYEIEWPSGAFKSECQELESILPSQVEVNRDLIENPSLSSDYLGLLRKFILLNVPINYV